MSEDYEKRLAEEVGSLSTRLVTAVNKQVELEETVLNLRKQISNLQNENVQMTKNNEKLKVILPKYIKLQDDYKEMKEKKEFAETENTKLQGEVEDLTASLFDEANTMVSNASRETHNFKIKNRKLYEELDEKDRIIEDLQDQLRDLKLMFVKIEEQQKFMTMSNHQHNLSQSSQTTTPRLEQNLEFTSVEGNELSKTNTVTTTEEQEEQGYQLQQLQIINSIRFDLNNFNRDFKSFVYQVIKPEFQLDLSHLKNLVFFKTIWSNEIENCITYIPNIPSNTLLNRWQKGKTFWSILIDGKVSIEPVKGSNETFKLAYKGGHSASGHSVTPVAIEDPCTFCGENRNDNLEHCRLYHLKCFENNSNDELVNNVSYPLCNYCVIKLRNLCDFFAKIRLIKSNIFKLKQNDEFDVFATTSSSSGFGSQFKRSNTITRANSVSAIPVSSSGERHSSITTSGNSSNSGNGELMNSSVHDIKLDTVEEGKLIKLYVMLLVIRLKIFWSKLGFWDNVEQINEVNLDEIHYETFAYLTPNLTQQPLQQRQPDQSNANTPKQSVVNSPRPSRVNSPRQSGVSSPKPPSVVSPKQSIDLEKRSPAATLDTRSSIKSGKQEEPITTVPVPKGAHHQDDDDDDDDEDEEFTDTIDDFEPVPLESNTEEPEPEPEQKSGLKRSNSKSKQFSDKINRDLDDTLEMLAENLNTIE
ncbi:SEC2 Rab guanine nucleotide exchange factor SEC2 [Candida maltosa Xu316]